MVKIFPLFMMFYEPFWTTNSTMWTFGNATDERELLPNAFFHILEKCKRFISIA